MGARTVAATAIAAVADGPFFCSPVSTLRTPHVESPLPPVEEKHMPPLDQRRLKAVLSVRGQTFSGFAAQLGISDRHLRNQFDGRRPTARLIEEMERRLGSDAWGYVTGRTTNPYPVATAGKDSE
jgi:hypothetical protein